MKVAHCETLTYGVMLAFAHVMCFVLDFSV